MRPRARYVAEKTICMVKWVVKRVSAATTRIEVPERTNTHNEQHDTPLRSKGYRAPPLTFGEMCADILEEGGCRGSSMMKRGYMIVFVDSIFGETNTRFASV